MKILCISHGSTLNGAERSFAEMLKALSLVGYELYAIFPEEGPLLELCKPYLQGFSIIYQPWWSDKGVRLSWKEKIKTIGRIVKYSSKVCDVIRNVNPNIVISNSSVNPCGAFASKVMRKKHLWYLRELGKEDLNFNFIYGKRLSLWLVNKLCSKILFNSFFLEANYEKFISKEKRCVIYQAVDIDDNLSPFLSKKEEENLSLILVGRFAEGKGQFEAIKAVRILIDQGEKVKLSLVGQGTDSYSIMIKNYIEENELTPFVTLVPFSKDVNNCYAQADVSLVCSRSEAFGRVTVESMKMRLPVIASNTGANVELIRDAYNGYLYHYGDEKDLAEKILLFKNTNKVRECATNAKIWADETFSIEIYSQNLKEILNEYE